MTRDAHDLWRSLTAPWADRRNGLVIVPHDDSGYHDWVSWGTVRKSRALTATSGYPTCRWTLFICNNPDCPGQMWVREDRLVGAVMVMAGDLVPARRDDHPLQ